MTPEAPSDPPRKLVELPSGPLAVTDVGEGAPLLALHGLPGTARDWRWLGPCVVTRNIQKSRAVELGEALVGLLTS